MVARCVRCVARVVACVCRVEFARAAVCASGNVLVCRRACFVGQIAACADCCACRIGCECACVAACMSARVFGVVDGAVVRVCG